MVKSEMWVYIFPHGDKLLQLDLPPDRVGRQLGERWHIPFSPIDPPAGCKPSSGIPVFTSCAVLRLNGYSNRFGFCPPFFKKAILFRSGLQDRNLCVFLP